MNKYKIIFESNLSFAEKIKKAERLVKHEIDKSINNSIKKAFRDDIVWSEFSADYKNEKGDFENKLFYYYGDLENFDKNDWRFKEVKDNRVNVKFQRLVLHKDVHKLKQNHIKDYNKYLMRWNLN